MKGLRPFFLKREMHFFYKKKRVKDSNNLYTVYERSKTFHKLLERSSFKKWSKTTALYKACLRFAL